MLGYFNHISECNSVIQMRSCGVWAIFRSGPVSCIAAGLCVHWNLKWGISKVLPYLFGTPEGCPLSCLRTRRGHRGRLPPLIATGRFGISFRCLSLLVRMAPNRQVHKGLCEVRIRDTITPLSLFFINPPHPRSPSQEAFDLYSYLIRKFVLSSYRMQQL